MSVTDAVVRENISPRSPQEPGVAALSNFASDRSAAENGQRALLNILEDFAIEKASLEGGQRAMLNILDDFGVERTLMAGAQRAVLNILEDSVLEKAQAEAAQRSMLNILDDFAAEKAQLEAFQGAMVNILDDFSQEKDRLEETQRAVLNILDDFESEKFKVESANHQLKQQMEERKRVEVQMHTVNAELLTSNKELEAFSYSVSHDLRAPLRGIDGFSLVLLEDYADKLDANGKDYLHRVRTATQRMGTLIDDMLNLARVARTEIRPERFDLGALAHMIASELQKTQPERSVTFRIADGLEAFVDSHLIRIALENLLGNAWKFTSKRATPCIEFGKTTRDGMLAYYVRDDGAGFDPAHASRLFGAFQRLHDKSEFPGTGVGLATVQRVIHRLGGRIWAESSVGTGATFYFTLSETKPGGLSNA
jgi:signal transduction histidine kinase